MSRSYQLPPTLHEDLRAMRNWIHLRPPHQHFRFSLDYIHQDILREGLKYLRELIRVAIAKDVELYEMSRAQMSPWNERQKGFAYAGWSRHPPPPSCVDKLDRDALMSYLVIDVSLYGSVMNSVSRWEKEITPQEDVWQFDYVDEVWRNENGMEMSELWG